jgi:hypothetical protein
MLSMMSTDPRRSIGRLGGVICGSPAAAPCIGSFRQNVRQVTLAQGRAEALKVNFEASSFLGHVNQVAGSSGPQPITSRSVLGRRGKCPNTPRFFEVTLTAPKSL